MTVTEIFQIIASFIGSLGFAILFNIHGKRLLLASIGGMLSWILFILFNKAIGNDVIAYFIVAGIISIYAEIMARKLKVFLAIFFAAITFFTGKAILDKTYAADPYYGTATVTFNS